VAGQRELLCAGFGIPDNDLARRFCFMVTAAGGDPLSIRTENDAVDIEWGIGC